MYRDDLLNRLGAYLDENILKVKEQKEKSEQFANLSNETQFGVAKEVKGDTSHENATMFSCGSLAPKLKRGGGCMDHGFSRAQEPWELSDGCVYLLRELSKARSQSDPKVTAKALDLFVKHAMTLADLGFVDHFKHAASLKENLFQTMREIVSPDGIGKKKFRSFVEIFLDPAFRNTNHSSQNCALAAQDFLLELSKVYGDGICRAIIENHDSKYLATFDKIKAEANAGQQDFVYPAQPAHASQMYPGAGAQPQFPPAQTFQSASGTDLRSEKLQQILAAKKQAEGQTK